MKIAITFAAVAGLLVPASPALAAPAVTPGRADTPVPTVAAAPAAIALVARWDFNGGAVGGRVADTSGRGPALTVRLADQGAIRFEGGPSGDKYAVFPVACATGATTCPRGLLEAADDADLNPGLRLFRWSARVHLSKDQIRGSSNIMQKGVTGTGSLWKMQLGATNGRAQCVVSGAGSSTLYVVRSATMVADGLWHKILCQRAGATLAVFVDNVQRGQITIPANLTIGNTAPLRVGGPNFNTTSDMYHGLLDDVYAELG
jgi:hypothetical protein